MPRSPWQASVGCTKKAGVPVEANVAAIFWPTWPLLPMPVTMTRPARRPASPAAAASKGARHGRRAAPRAAAEPLALEVERAQGGCNRKTAQALAALDALEFPQWSGRRHGSVPPTPQRRLRLEVSYNFRALSSHAGRSPPPWASILNRPLTDAPYGRSSAGVRVTSNRMGALGGQPAAIDLALVGAHGRNGRRAVSGAGPGSGANPRSQSALSGASQPAQAAT